MAEYGSMSSEATGLSGAEAIFSDREQLLGHMVIEIDDQKGKKRRDKEF